MKQQTVTISVPATSANLGPGFDCLGVALGLRNQVIIKPRTGGLLIRASGEGAADIARDASNLVTQAAIYLFQRAASDGRLDEDGLQALCQLPFEIEQHNTVPMVSGLGSSSTAVVTGLLAGNAFLEDSYSLPDLLNLAAQLEGHPDNVTPALLGGMRLIVNAEPVRQIQIDTPLRQAAVVMPAIHFPTAAARAALPAQVPFRDAVFNASRLGMLLHALEEGDFELMAVCMQDRLHQPYRLPLIPGSEAALEAARAMGGVAALSGAGPSLIAFAPRRLPEVAAAMQAAFAAAGLESRTWILPLDEEGSQLRVSPANLATGPQFC